MANMELLMRSLSFIEDNLDNEIKTEDIAQACYISKSSLEKMFKESVRFSVHDYKRRFIVYECFCYPLSRLQRHDPKKFKAMEIYTILMELNRKMIFGEEISDAEKSKAVSFFLDGICEKDEIVKYKKRMGVNTEADNIYPNYYIPPYDGNKKLRLIQGYLPKTNILYANHYELEIIRLLYIFAPENKTVNEMARNTLQRLKRTCFGNSCPQGECLATGISVLRFLAVICPDNIDWIEKLCTPLGELFLSFGQGQASIKQSVPLSYLLMAFTDINTEKTRTLIKQKQEWLLNLLRRGWITGKLSNGKISEGDTYNLMGKYIIRNAIGILPEFKDVSKYEIYVNDKDKRCYCNI